MLGRLLKSGSIIGILFLQSCASLTGTADQRPNFLIIVTDDQRYDTMEYMPQTRSIIFDQGVTFTNGFITTPLCCPSRSSILTGMYAHNHGVHENGGELKFKTFIEDMHENGYYTGLVGKYLNSWHGQPRPEYDYWVSYGNGETRYYNPRLNVNGEWIRHQDQYVTYALGNYAVDFIKSASRQNKPFILLYTPNAPHDPVTPAKEDRNLLQDLAPYRPPSFDEADMSDKPSWLADSAPLTPDEISQIDEFRRNQLLTLISLDRAVGKLLHELKNSGKMDQTVIMFISDNGKFWGEHRMTSKNGFYEEATKVPFALRYPPLVPTPYKENRLVANIDIAPTIYQLAGLSIPSGVDGISMVNLFTGRPWRDALLIEGWPGRGVYSAIHTDRYVYSETIGDKSEFYDLQIDPYELTNSIDNSDYREIIADLQQELHKLQEPAPTPSPAP